MIEIEFSWKIGKDKIFYPGGKTSFIGDYESYLQKKIKYFFSETIIQKDNTYKDYLGILFIDNGGIGWKRNISWIEEGIKRIEKVLNNLSDEEDWGGEGFGAEIKKEGVLIYFLTDDNYFDIIPLSCFYKAMVSWRGFLETKPDENNIMNIKCEE